VGTAVPSPSVETNHRHERPGPGAGTATSVGAAPPTTADGPAAPAPARRPTPGPRLNEYGYYVGRVAGNLYRVTDLTYQSAFLTTPDGVVLFDAPPSIGHNIQRAIDEVAATSGVSNRVSHLIYSHHHADHTGASSLFGEQITRIGHESTRALLLRDDDPARPAPEETFQDRCSLEIGGERVELSWHGPNHSPDNIFIHLPGHAALMLVDIVTPGSAAICQSNLADDVPGYIEAVDIALTYPWKHFIAGHVGRLGTRVDIATHRRYLADIVESSREALGTVDPSQYSVDGCDDSWAAMRHYLDAITAVAAGPVIEKYSGVLEATDAFTAGTTFRVLQSVRLDLGIGSNIHP
jgi:glyoxylase-like metal-dependent hydrolase (beta-lactamase superfamily II)